MAISGPWTSMKRPCTARGCFERRGRATRKLKRELQDTYGVRLFSEHERARLVYDTPEPKAKVGKRKARRS